MSVLLKQVIARRKPPRRRQRYRKGAAAAARAGDAAAARAGDIGGNSIRNNHYGIFVQGVGQVVHATLSGNHFRGVAVPVKRVIVY